MIKVTGLKKHFGDLEVLKGIDQHIKQGEKVVVIGPSGSGKSTFLRCLNLLEVPTEGEILIEGESITAPKTNVNKIREKMGMVFQQFNLFPHLTVLDNITLAPIKVKKMPKAEAEKLARELLNKVGLADKEDSYPAQLSGGQQQRIAIARALAMQPFSLFFAFISISSSLESVSAICIAALQTSLLPTSISTTVPFYAIRLHSYLQDSLSKMPPANYIRLYNRLCQSLHRQNTNRSQVLIPLWTDLFRLP